METGFSLSYHSTKTSGKLLARGFLFHVDETGNPWIAEEVSLGASRAPDLNFTTLQLRTSVLTVDDPSGSTVVTCFKGKL